MKYLKFIIAICFFGITAISQAQTSPQTAPTTPSKYQFENDSSLLNMFQRWALIARYDMSYTGTHELPLIPELKNIQANTLLEAMTKTLDAYKKHNTNILFEAGIDDGGKHLILKSSLRPPVAPVPTAAKAPATAATQTQATPAATGYTFQINANDASLIRLWVRWATQIGYGIVINNQAVDLKIFPLHANRYNDYVLLQNMMSFKTNAPLRAAISESLLFYTGLPLAPYEVNVDDNAKKLIITSLVK